MGTISTTAVCCFLESGVFRSPPGWLMEAWLNQAEEQIRETLPVTGHRFWALGQGGIYFVDAEKTPAVMKFVDLTSRKVTILTTLSKPPANSLEVFRSRPMGVTHCIAKTT